jgi:transposase
MDVHKHSREVERLEIVEASRRHRWSEDEKLKIVFESLQSADQITATARRYGISRSQLYMWRRAFRGIPPTAAAFPGRGRIVMLRS